jgi:hypothetical protein
VSYCRWRLRNLFTGEDGEFSPGRWRVLCAIIGLAVFGCGMYFCRNMPREPQQQQPVTVTVNDPGGAPVTVIVNQP